MIEIFHASALDFSPDGFGHDVLICDAPYSPHVHDNCASVGVAGGEGMGAHARDLGFAALTPELRLFVAMAAACARRWSAVFSDLEGAHAWRVDAALAGAEYIREVPWIRWSQPQLSGDRPCSGAEAILVWHAQNIGPRGGRKPVAKHWNGPGSLTHFERRCMRGQDKHPTEKPIDLALDLVCYFSDPGELVLDLCGGAGTTAVACRLLGRNCVVVENDEQWAGFAERRVRARLSPRDDARAKEWCVSVASEAASVPFPSAPDGSDVRTWERAQRRLADVERVAAAL